MTRTGRPRASSRETISEAACELFFEQGYDGTSITDITRRAGVARSSFFNYFAAKSDVLWGGFDARAAAAIAALDAPGAIDEALAGIGRDFAPDALALAIAHSEAMRIAEELDRDRAVRQLALQRAIAARGERDGETPMAAEVRAGALAAAVFAAIWSWASRGAGEESLSTVLRTALAFADPVARVGDGEGPATA